MRIKHRLHFFICAILTLNSIYVSSQVIEHDFGLFVGTSQYNGDVNMTKAYYKPHLSFGLLYKQVYNPHYSLRFGLSYAGIGASDSDFSSKYQEKRYYDFSNHNIYEFSSLLEFNFYKITKDKDEDNFSPYISAGVAVFFAPKLELVNFGLPVGAGLKIRLAPKVELNIEWVFRKTFTDKLDGLNADAVGNNDLKQHSIERTKDWYSLLGASILVCFASDKRPCHAYKEKKTYEIGRKRRYK